MEISRWREMMKQNVIICKDPAKPADSLWGEREEGDVGVQINSCFFWNSFYFKNKKV